LGSTSGVDTIYGGSGNDIIHSDGDGGIYYGEGGDDTMYLASLDSGSITNPLLTDPAYTGLPFTDVSYGAEHMHGGDGVDTIIFPMAPSDNGHYYKYWEDEVGAGSIYIRDVDIQFNMSTGYTNLPLGQRFTGFENAYMGYGHDVIYGTSSTNEIRGGGGDDTLYGLSGHDVLDGQRGNDVLYGGDGNDHLIGENYFHNWGADENSDHLFGGKGNDILQGGAGQDILTGGLGADKFRYEEYWDSTSTHRDIIRDFNWMEGDKIDLSLFDADNNIAGIQSFAESQMSYNSTTNIFTANILGYSPALEIELMGSGIEYFEIRYDVIV